MQSVYSTALPDWARKLRSAIEFLLVEKIASIDNHRHMVNVYADQVINLSTVRLWVMHFNNDGSNWNDKANLTPL